MRKALTAGVVALSGLVSACSGQPPLPTAPTWSAPMPSTAGASTAGAEAALLQWIATSGATRGAYFLPPVNATGDVFAGSSRVFVNLPLDGGGIAICTMETDGSHSFFRVGSKGVMDHVNGTAALKYQRFAAGGAKLEELTGAGKLNVHIQGELQTIIADGENGELWTILRVNPDARSSAESMSGAGKVGAAGSAPTRDLRCGIKSDAKSGVLRSYIELR